MVSHRATPWAAANGHIGSPRVSAGDAGPPSTGSAAPRRHALSSDAASAAASRAATGSRARAFRVRRRTSGPHGRQGRRRDRRKKCRPDTVGRGAQRAGRVSTGRPALLGAKYGAGGRCAYRRSAPDSAQGTRIGNTRTRSGRGDVALGELGPIAARRYAASNGLGAPPRHADARSTGGLTDPEQRKSIPEAMHLAGGERDRLARSGEAVRPTGDAVADPPSLSHQAASWRW